MLLDRAWIAARIPHHGTMCLLDRVDEWDAERVRCSAISHRAADNPLRAHGRLAAACGIEYAAQAMAIHGALIAQESESGSSAPRQGYLASARSVQCHVGRLDDIAADLRIEVVRFSGDSNTILYDFSVHADSHLDTRLLLAGRAAVFMTPR